MMILVSCIIFAECNWIFFATIVLTKNLCLHDDWRLDTYTMFERYIINQVYFCRDIPSVSGQLTPEHSHAINRHVHLSHERLV